MRRPIHTVTIKRRRGALLVFAMIALLVTSMIGAALLRNSMMSLQQIRREQLHLQAGLLAEAGCQRAVFKLQSDAGYTSEVWKVPAEELAANSTATITVTISDESDTEVGRTITAVAVYPDNSPSQFRVTKKLTLHPRTSSK